MDPHHRLRPPVVSIPTVWRRKAWRAHAIAWIRRRLRDRATAITGEIEQVHVVAWSTAFRVPTDRGVVYFKATWPPQRYEEGTLTSWGFVYAKHQPKTVVNRLALVWFVAVGRLIVVRETEAE